MSSNYPQEVSLLKYSHVLDHIFQRLKLYSCRVRDKRLDAFSNLAVPLLDHLICDTIILLIIEMIVSSCFNKKLKHPTSSYGYVELFHIAYKGNATNKFCSRKVSCQDSKFRFYLWHRKVLYQLQNKTKRSMHPCFANDYVEVPTANKDNVINYFGSRQVIYIFCINYLTLFEQGY